MSKPINGAKNKFLKSETINLETRNTSEQLQIT